MLNRVEIIQHPPTYNDLLLHVGICKHTWKIQNHRSEFRRTQYNWTFVGHWTIALSCIELNNLSCHAQQIYICKSWPTSLLEFRCKEGPFENLAYVKRCWLSYLTLTCVRKPLTKRWNTDHLVSGATNGCLENKGYDHGTLSTTHNQ
jgi:hypothetical protein